MKRVAVLLALALALALASCDGRPAARDTAKLDVASREAVTSKDDFESEKPKWNFAVGHWERRRASDGWVLAKTGERQTYNVALLEDRRFGDIDARVRFRPVFGAVDASGGLVVRAQDAQNYYIVRANALEDNFRLYATTNGERRQIASTKAKAPALGSWHTLRIVARADHIQAYLDDELLIDHRDGTFREGWVGVWTKEDSVTEFDDVVITGTATR